MTRKLTIPLFCLAVLAFPILVAGVAQAHGYTAKPPSRSYLCAQGVVTDCGEIQYEPQSVEGPKGFPGSGPDDGTICAGGNGRFAELDDPRGGAWPATSLTSGAGYDFVWHFTARHATTSFRYFITRDGYDPTQPLTRADLEPTPFLSVPWNGIRPTGDVTNHGTIPSGKSGRHLILGVWDIADTGNAFYSCADVLL
ncbi:lytic polysaccharide monooxygenase [Solihabitans fulvus]|uniref:Lytic polysaccharide monooxygenase n=1 Tax=Solihabitans fulvus TaxID=1892852 RepID=A0A5B2WFN4_9PSEU|nr:lytic polysaccharide monooxygenase auxiliary activity family 9 protein [Solihabitans fulvus]KAA2250983.1 lytic polysaccharide monooxygenase [Solihabitans fulvus]